MIKTIILQAKISRTLADSLNRESGRVYSRVLTNHYRIYRKHQVWLSSSSAEHLDDYYSQDETPLLHSHSKDSAQQGFYKALKTSKSSRKNGSAAKYPHKRKYYRTTIWKNTAIYNKEDHLLLALARGRGPIKISLPPYLQQPTLKFCEVRLVYNRGTDHYDWHLVIDDELEPPPPPGENIVAVDLGEIHPATVTDGQAAVVISARELRSTKQYTAKRLASMQKAQSGKKKYSRSHKRLQKRKGKFLAKQKRKIRDIEHKVSRAVVDFAMERKAEMIVIGDVRDIARGKKLRAKSQQKIGVWSHGKQRSYIEQKATARGINVQLVSEKQTSQSCPNCSHRYKPRGRKYECPACGFCGHRDVVGALNILSRYRYGEVSKIALREKEKYRHPYACRGKGKRSRPDTAEMAGGQPSEAAQL